MSKLYRLQLLWRVLTKNNWYLINATAPKYPWDLWIGNIQVKYHQPPKKERL